MAGQISSQIGMKHYLLHGFLDEALPTHVGLSGAHHVGDFNFAPYVYTLPFPTLILLSEYADFAGGVLSFCSPQMYGVSV